jgi:hypothetical protein
MAWAGDTTPIANVVQNEVTAITGANYQTAVQALVSMVTVTTGSGASKCKCIYCSNFKSELLLQRNGSFFYEKVGVGDGSSFANNPFLQEMPDPVS